MNNDTQIITACCMAMFSVVGLALNITKITLKDMWLLGNQMRQWDREEKMKKKLLSDINLN